MLGHTLVHPTLSRRPNASRTGTRTSNVGTTHTWFDPDANEWIVYFSRDIDGFRFHYEIVTDFTDKDNVSDEFHWFGKLPQLSIHLGASELITL